MSPTRTVAILLATVMLLSAAGVACAASSKLTPMPPTALSSAPAKPKPVPLPPIAARTTSARTTGAIPLTGIDLPIEVLLAVLLIVAGATLRPRRPEGRA